MPARARCRQTRRRHGTVSIVLALAVLLLPAPTLLAQEIVPLPLAATIPLDSTVDVLTLPAPARTVTPTEIRVKPFLTRDPEGLQSWRQQLQGATETVPPTQELIEDGALPPSTSSPEASVTFSFDGLRDSDNATLAGTQVLPPDDNLGVGPSHIVEMVNSIGRVSDRLGANLVSFSLRNLFGVDAVEEADPRVIYDSRSGRWFGTYLQLSSFPATSGSSSIILIVSFTSDPTAGFCRYRMGNPSSETFFQDFPHIGVSDDKVVVSYNAFSFPGSPLGAGYYVINKSHLLACASASVARVHPEPCPWRHHACSVSRKHERSLHGNPQLRWRHTTHPSEAEWGARRERGDRDLHGFRDRRLVRPSFGRAAGVQCSPGHRG